MCPVKEYTLRKILDGESYEHEETGSSGSAIVSFCRFDNQRVEIQHRCCLLGCHDWDLDVSAVAWKSILPMVTDLLSKIENTKTPTYRLELEWQISRLLDKRDQPFSCWINKNKK